MKKWCLILVLLSNGHYINTDHIMIINEKRKLIEVTPYGYSSHHIYVNDEDILKLKQAMKIYGQ